MVQVRPTDTSPLAKDILHTTDLYQTVYLCLGLIYLACSIGCSWFYISLLKPAFSNDVWWKDFNTSGDQALVVDLFNKLLMYEVNGSVNLLDFEATMEKRYDTLDATTAIYPSYVRRVALTECNSIEFAVKNLRTVGLPWLMYLPTQYCWVDLGRQFEIAHTDARQQRCIDQYKSNGAMYLETILRNQETPAGQAWLTTTSMARQSYSVAQEVAFWGSHNISSFMLQWQNCWQTGIQETLTIVNALGMTQSITLKKVAYEDETWTSYVLNSLFENDMLGAAGVNASLIWSASNSFKAVPGLSFEFGVGLQDMDGNFVGKTAIFRSFLGPFLSVDCFNVALPPSIVDLYRYFQSAILGAIINDLALQKHFNDIRSTTHYPTPASWSTDPPWMFYGGNIMCFNGSPQPFVQESFNFYDTCNEQAPLAVTSTKYSNLFATMVMSDKRDTSSICALQSSVDCSSNLEVAAALARKLVGLTVSMTPFVKRATEDLQRLNVGIIQFAADQDAENWTLLRQGLLDDPDWAYFGWLMIYDWVEGQREVLSFEGDATTMRLISSADSPSQYPSNFDSLTSATRLIYYSVLYTSLILSAIVVASVVYVLCSRFKANGWNLFWFNRIVSSVWIGRPLMFVRGATAALLLSTTQLQTTASPYARFIVPWYEISVLAGEATWILYVAHDLLSVVISRQYAASYCASGCMLAWSALILLEFMWPVMATSSISHDCSAVNLNFGIVCSSGVLRLGSLARVWLIFMIQVTALIFTLLAVGVKHYSNTMRRNMSSGLDLYALGIADHFIFAKRQKRSSFHDYVTCLMAGFVQMRWGSKVYIFDVKLWVILVQDLTHTTTIESILSRRGSVTAMCGIAYAGVAIFCSVSYLSLSSVNMANDLYWANFNISGAHAFIANWLNMQLVLGITNQTLTLNMAQINLHGSFSSAVDSTVVKAPFKHGALIQHSELNSNITSIIQGLRLTDPCLAPWIFTAYCFVDFDQRWEMANSAARQTRCQKMLSNGAIYLESVLRNIDFERFYNCWGSAFDVAISNELKQSNMGRDWLSSIPLVVDSPISNEVILWLGHNITTFDIQLQNFKSVGFVNTYAIENAYGISYPFTLQSQRYGFRFQKQTSLKMYWGLASDFTAVIQNNSGIVGCSLVRSSSMYAVANTTIQSALQINGTLSSPLVNSYVVFAENIGPFGSIDMRFQACPKEAKQAVLSILQALRLTLAKNVTSQIAFSQLPDPTQIFVVAPKAWQDRSFITMGGNPLCPTASLSSSQSASNGLLALLSWTADCTTTIPMANMIPDRETVIVSAILTNLTDPSGVSIETICQQDAWYKLPCLTLLNQTVAFLQTFMNSNLDSLIKLSSPASSATQRTRVQLFQFGQDNADASLEMHLLDILDPSQPEFTFFSWIYVVDWALGLREAVIIEGDFTEYLNPIKQPVNTAETPLILALYMRSTVLYITGVMVGLAGAMLYYILLSRGHIEVLNLMELQRVGAVVWAGRPVLFIRSLTAIALMSTATLQLQYTGYITYFDVGQSSWYNILLAANEVTWMVAVVNDIGLAITRQYTAYYATINSILIWSVTALLSGLVPAQHSLTISKQCHPEQADFEIICTSGIVVIGHKSRLLILVVILLGCNAMCYLATRLWFRGRSRLMNEIRSPYVYAGARYLFTTSNWVWNDIYYMDRMSALLNGILTVRLGTVMHCLDIKQWRTFAVELVPISNIPQSHPLVEPSNFALPLSMKATKQ